MLPSDLARLANERLGGELSEYLLIHIFWKAFKVPIGKMKSVSFWHGVWPQEGALSDDEFNDRLKQWVPYGSSERIT